VKRLLLITIVLLLIPSGDCFGQSARKSKVNSGGAITGRITLNDKGVGGVQVCASLNRNLYTSLGVQYTTSTDGDGQFRLSNLAGGIYQVWLEAPAFIVSDIREFTPMGKPVVVNEGETVDDVNFTLVRGGVITGKVIDADGRPVIGEYVRLVPTDAKLGEAIEALFGQDQQTDDRGVYRIYGLPPGSYKVAVGPSRGDIYEATRGRRTFKQTFYPDVTDEAKAKVVEVGSGAEALNIDIAVGRPVDGFAASGRVVDAETGQPLAGVPFDASVVTDEGWSSAQLDGVSDRSVNFRIDNLPAGKYSISLTPQDGTEYVGETKPFEILDRDVTDLELKAARGATLTGTVALEGTEDKSLHSLVSRAHLRFFIRSRNGFFQQEVALGPDGSFRTTGVPDGTIRVIFDSRQEVGEKFSLIRIERDGIEQPRWITVEAGDQITGLRIVVGYGTGTLSGTTKIQNGTLLPTSYVYAELQRQSVRGLETIISTSVDSGGRFLFEHVPTGSYEVVVEVYDSKDQTVFKGRQPIVISDGLVSKISVPIDLKSNP